MPRLTDQSQTILGAARSLLAAAMPLIESRGITLVGISLTNLEDADRIQLTLTDDWRPDALDAALDEVRNRYGSAAVTRAVLVGRDPGNDAAMPLLPDVRRRHAPKSSDRRASISRPTSWPPQSAGSTSAIDSENVH